MAERPELPQPSRSRPFPAQVLIVFLALVLALLTVVALERDRRSRQSRVPDVIRLEQGVVAKYDENLREYVNLGLPATLGENDMLLTRDETRNRIRLPRGGRMVVDARTGLTVSQLSDSSGRAHVRFLLGEGRVWLDPTSREEVSVATNSARVVVSGGTCEVRVHQDKDYFRNTVVSVFAGTARLEKAPGLTSPTVLAAGTRQRTDDATTYPRETFATQMDAWEEWSSREH